MCNTHTIGFFRYKAPIRETRYIFQSVLLIAICQITRCLFCLLLGGGFCGFFGCGRCEGERNLCSSPGGYGEIKVDELPQKNIDLTTKTPNLNYFNNPEMRIKPNEFVRSFSFENKYNNAEYNTININLNNYIFR